MSGPTNIRTFFTIALMTSLVGVTGCGRRMLKNYSSLAPKTASIERLDSTFRSQNEVPGSQPQNTTGWAGHSGGPTARLLKPDFGTANLDRSSSPSRTNFDHSADKSMAVSSGGHSLAIAADQVRQRMNQQVGSNKTIDLLPEKKELWKVLSGASIKSAALPHTAEPTENAYLGSSENAAESTEPLSQQPFAAEPESSTFTRPVGDTSSVDDISPIAERSVLDRLRGLYDDRESSAKQLFKRNLQRLPNPWNVFREKEVPANAEPVDLLLPPFPTESASIDSEAPVSRDGSVTDELIAAVESELQNWPLKLNGQRQTPREFQRRQQDLRLLHLIAGRPEEAIATIDDMSGPEQEFWQELMLGLAHFRADDHPNREQRLTVTAAQLRSAIAHISAEASLRFRRLEICSRINSFGRIEPFLSNEFDPGQPMLLYVELENFGTQLTSRGTRKTKFDAQLQFLHHDSTDPIETIELSDIHDEATSERTDYFQSFELNIPSHLAPGLYKIRLQIRDVVRRKQAEGFIEFQVREPVSGQ